MRSGRKVLTISSPSKVKKRSATGLYIVSHLVGMFHTVRHMSEARGAFPFSSEKMDMYRLCMALNERVVTSSMVFVLMKTSRELTHIQGLAHSGARSEMDATSATPWALASW